MASIGSENARRGGLWSGGQHRAHSAVRAEVEAAQGQGYDHFEFSLFDLELFFGEGRVTIREAVALGYEDTELSFSDFLAAIPDGPAGARMPGQPRRVIVPSESSPPDEH
jgi:hypothetical protein